MSRHLLAVFGALALVTTIPSCDGRVQGPSDVGVQVALVEFVEDHATDPVKLWIGLEAAKK